MMAADPDPSYAYSPLNATQDEIRVLTVHAGRGEEPIHTTLKHISLRRPSKYETISYVWGDAQERDLIIIGGKTLDVPASAERAIRRMRTDVDRTLWIDAVCINQKDIRECEQQVSLMGDIYRKTTQNLVWLGKSQDTTATAIEAMDAMWNDILHATDNLETFYEATCEAESSRYSELHKFCPHNVSALLTFFSNTWFQRLWCVQEVALPASSIVICGEFELPLLKVLRVAQWCWHKNRYLNLVDLRQPFAFNELIDAFKNPMMLLELVDRRFGSLARHSSEGERQYIAGNESLLHFIEYSMQFETSKPSDKVFATLGLLQKYHSSDDARFWALLKPNYEKPLAHVARDATKAAILESGSLAVLSKVYHHGNAPQGGPQIPSWVPRLHERWNRSTDPSPFFGYDAYPKGVETQIVESWFTADPDVLSLRGVFIDSISRVSPVFTNACLDNIEAMTEQIRTINGMLGLAESGDPEPVVKALARTLIATKNPHNSDHIYQTFLGWATTIQRQSIGLFRILSTDNAEARTELDEEKDYNDDVILHCTNRRFFCTTCGGIGLGPSEMSVADIVAVVPGYSRPLVLRPDGDLIAVATFLRDRIETEYTRRNGKPDEYTFVGDCYVDKMMYGEVAIAHRELGQEDEVFNLR